jgi:hypothetical protein
MVSMQLRGTNPKAGLGAGNLRALFPGQLSMNGRAVEYRQSLKLPPSIACANKSFGCCVALVANAALSFSERWLSLVSVTRTASLFLRIPLDEARKRPVQILSRKQTLCWLGIGVSAKVNEIDLLPRTRG